MILVTGCTGYRPQYRPPVWEEDLRQYQDELNPPLPTPSPSPSPGGAHKAVVLGDACWAPLLDPGLVCERPQNSEFLAHIEDAVEELQQSRPELFTSVARSRDGLLRVRDADGLLEAVMEDLQDRGLCTQAQGGEVAVATPGARKLEYFRLWNSRMELLHGGVMFHARCPIPGWGSDANPNRRPAAVVEEKATPVRRYLTPRILAR